MAKYCRHCGSALREGAAFCHNCGRPAGSAPGTQAAAPAPAYAPPRETPGVGVPGQARGQAVYPAGASVQKTKKKGRGCLIAGIVVLAVVIGVLFLGGLGLTWFLDRYDDQNKEAEIRTVELTLPASTGARAVVEEQAAVAVEAYLVARAYADKLENYDLDSFDPNEYAALLDRTAAAYEAADALAEGLEENAALLCELEDAGVSGAAGTVSVRQLAAGQPLQSPLLTTAYADDKEEKTPKEWAEDIQRIYDAYPPGRAIQGLAHAMKTDAAHAAVMHQQAQAIIKGEADAEADFYNAAYITAVETKAAATVAGAAVAVVATGGTAGAVAHALAVGGTVCSGAQAVLDVGTAYTIHTTNGEGNEYTAAFERTSSQFAPVAGVFGLLNAGVNVYNVYKGVDVYDNTVQGVIWAANGLLDYVQNDGMLLGGTFTQNKDGTVSFTMIETMLGQDPKQKEAAKQVLEQIGLSDATIELAQAIADGEQEAPEEEPGLGAAADYYIDQWDIFTDPDDPFDAAGFNDYMSERFAEAAAEQPPAAAGSPQLNPESDIFGDDEPGAPAAESTPEPKPTPEPRSESDLVGGYEEGITGTYWFVSDSVIGAEELHMECSAEVLLHDSGTMEVTFGRNVHLTGTYDPRSHTFVGTCDSRAGTDLGEFGYSPSDFELGPTTLVFDTGASPVTAAGWLDAANIRVMGDWYEDMSRSISMVKTD